MDLTAGKKAFLLIGFHVDSIDEVSRKRIEKQLDNIDISKVTTFTTAQEMIFYSMALEWQYIKSDQNDRQLLLCFAVQAVNAFEMYNRKNIAADIHEKSLLDSLYATFQLMVTQLKLRLEEITIQEVDFPLMKTQLMLVFNCEFAENCFVYMRYMMEDFVINLLELHYLKTARVFMNLCTHILGYIQKTNEKVTKQPYLLNTDKGILYAENNFFEAYLLASSQMMQKDSFWTFEKGAKEGILEDLLMKLGMQDKYEYIPEMIQTFKQAEEFCKIYFSKIDELEKLCPILDQADKAYAYQLFYPMKMRGEAYYIMADYQKDGYKKAKLSEQSMKIFNKILEDDFKEEMLQQYVKSDAQYILSIYCLIDVRNIMNYNNLIGVKVDYLMNLPTDAEETKLRLKELNILRRDYAVQMLTFEKFAKKNTDVCAHEHLMTTYLNIATQFRSIILSHQKNLQHNLDRSNTFLMQFVDLSKSDPETIDLFTLPNAYILAVGALAERIDKDLFIKKFRKDFTTDS